MSLKPDSWIRDAALKRHMIEPFADHSPPGPIISYGLSSYGYNLRLADEFKIFTNVNTAIVDPKAFSKDAFVNRKGSVCIMPPNSYVLGRPLEYFRIPRNVMGIVLGKSTLARCGLIVNCTPLEPEWNGHITIEISNSTPLPATLYANEGIAQVLFFEADGPCERSYADKKGKYQGQRGIVLPRL